MADILKNWLNNEIELSQPVDDFAKDFANGYLFGELLYKFNQQSNFKEFSKKDLVATKLDNFQKLEGTLRNLKIKFDSRMINEIIQEKRGVSLRLLYQLKMALEKVYPPTDIAVLRKTGKMGDNQPALKIAHPKETYDAHAHTFFAQRLQVLNKPQKALNMEKHLHKFEDEKTRQDNERIKFHQEQLDQQTKVKSEIRRAQINKLQRNAGFMEEWNVKGVEDWKKNQTIKKDRERTHLEFEYKQAKKFNEITMRKIDEANKEVHEGISNFEQTLKQKGITPHVQKEEAERIISDSFQNSPMRMTQKVQRMSQSLLTNIENRGASIDGQTGNLMTKMGGMTLTSTGLKAKDKKTITEKTRKERERRRRKMIVDQSKTHSEMESKLREQQIVERMKRQAKQENELSYEQWRTFQCKNVIIDNRKLREAQYDKRRELDQQTAIWREEEMIKQMEQQMNREMEVFKERDNEMRILHKQFRREGRSTFAEDLLNSIFEIADQAYNHQQLCDSNEIDSRNWHEWIQMFVENMVIDSKSNGQIEFQQKQIVEQQDQQDQQQEQIEIDQQIETIAKLDHMELVDYLKNQGQWPNTLITESKLNIEQILLGQSEISGGIVQQKGAKAPQAKVQVEAVQIEEGDTEIPTQAPNNYILGDALETIININFEERKKQDKPIIPNHLSLKLCLIGYQFAGKITQATKLKEQFGVQVFQMSTLVQEAIQIAQTYDFSTSIQEVINQDINEEYNEVEEYCSNNEEFSAEQQQQQYSEKYLQNEFANIGKQISELIYEGQEISDQIYVQLFITKLRMEFPYKSQKQLQKELISKVKQQIQIEKQLMQRELEINGEQQVDQQTGKRKKKRSNETIQEKITLLQKSLLQLQNIDKNGWVLVDFPTSFAQAKLLETALSGHIPKVECNPVQRELEQSETNLLVQPNNKELPPQLLIQSGVDSMIWFDCDKQTVISRAIGRRYDQVNDKMYHIQLQRPLTTSAPLCERLTPINEEFNNEATLIDRWIAFDAHSKSLENWLLQFGDYETERCILSTIDGNQNEDSTYLQIVDILNNILQLKQVKEQNYKDQIKQKILLKEEQMQETLRLQQQEEEEKLKREQEGIIDQKEEQKQDSRVHKPEQSNSKVAPKEPNIKNIENDIKGTIYKEWQTLSTNYKGQMKKVFKQVRGQRERMTEKLSHVQKQFLHFLHRPDQKQDKLETFITSFNNFSDQYPDLREDDQTKEELHQRVDILSDELWEIIEERKEQEIEERKKIMESGWIEYELSFLVGCSQQLMQCEVDRFKGSIQIIHDYFHLFEDKLIPETGPQITTELVNEGEDLPPVEILQEGQDQFNIDHYTYPRLDKLFEKALKSQVVQDVTQIQALVQDKKGAQVKKDPKKIVQEEEKQIEESIYVKEMKKAIKVEKSLLRFRLIQIRNWCQKRLKEMRQKTLKVYQKVDEWINVATKTENDAIDEMSIVLKKAIEEEKKIQDELRVKFMDFCVDQKIMNYIIPPPEKLPAMEQIRNDRFNIKQLKCFISEIEAIAEEIGNGINIPNKLIVDFFVRKHENSKSIGDECSLPEDWKTYNEHKFQTIVRNLDRQGLGIIDWKMLATFICLLKSPIPNEKEIDSYQNELLAQSQKEGFVKEQDFTKVKAWFDSYEISKDRNYSIPFTRVVFIKELLFNIHKEERGGEMKINVRNFVSLLKAKEQTLLKKSQLKVYADILFTPIEK